MLYKIQFSDGTIYKGGESIFNSKWNEIPMNKEIATLFYSLPDGNMIVLRGYESYNHIVEATQNIYGTKDLKPKVEAIYLMGMKDNKVTSYRIVLREKTKNDKYKIGDITRRQSDFGKEYYGRPTINWKSGIKKREIV